MHDALPPMRLEPASLPGRFATLEPLDDRHRADLRAAADADADIWALYPVNMSGAHFDGWWAQITRDAASGRWLPFAVVADGACVGVTCFILPDAANAGVEVGGTYLRPEVRGGAVNPQAKRLMLGHAFDSGARRVAFRVDALNLRSRAAVLKLGAVQEGILRQDKVVWTGRVRDTVTFSILADEWPAVRDRLDARLAAFDR